MQFVPAASLYLLSAIVTFTLAYVSWRLKVDKGVTWIMVMVFAGIWSLGTMLETLFQDLETKHLLSSIFPYFGVTGTIFFWSLFTIIYSNHKDWLNKFTVSLLAIVPVFAYLMALTSHFHTFFWESYYVVEKNGFVFSAATYDVGFWIWTVYAYLAIVFGALLLITAVIRSPRLYQGQATILIIGALIPLVSNLLFFVGLNPIAPLDISPVSLTLTGILITFGLVRLRLFSVMPVAHDLVFKGVTSGVIVIDLKNHIIDLNPAAEHIFNLNKNDLIGKKLSAVFPHYKPLIDQFEDIWDAKTEISVGTDDRTFELQIMPLTNRSGHRTVGRIILLLDISAKKQALAERDKLIGELDAYAHTVAHDLKNPISVITGYSGLIQHKEAENLSPSSLQQLTVIAQTGKKMGEIIDSLLLLANLNSAEQVESIPLNMVNLINNAWERVSKNFPEAGSQFTIQQRSWPTVVGYPAWVEQVWVNYLSNAIKYGGQPPLIEVGFDNLESTQNGPRPFVRFWVKDNGIGLSEEEASQLFHKFTRLAQHQAVGGHGLGLSIVQRIIERLDGTVGVFSQAGEGTTFYFTLPTASHNQPIAPTIEQTS